MQKKAMQKIASFQSNQKQVAFADDVDLDCTFLYIGPKRAIISKSKFSSIRFIFRETNEINLLHSCCVLSFVGAKRFDLFLGTRLRWLKLIVVSLCF